MNDFPNLETERLRLRELVLADTAALFAIHSDGVAMQWFGSDPLTDPAEAQRLIEIFAGWRKMATGTRWALERKKDLKFLGTLGLFNWNPSSETCSIGGELGRHAWGRGYMQEAVPCMLSWGFEHMALNRIEAQIHPRNAPSIKVVETFGFVYEGLLREAGYWLGTHHDMLQYSLLRRDYLSHRSSRPLSGAATLKR